jgi:hypothetical protein
MAKLLKDAVGKLSREEAEKYFRLWSADLHARMKLIDLAESVYAGPVDCAENQAVASLIHAADYLADRIAYEMNPHPKGMIRRSEFQ